MVTQMETTAAEVCLTEEPLKNIPHEMQMEASWVLWRWKEKDDGSQTKVPCVSSGLPASSTDEKTWTTFDNAVAAWRTGNFAGIGYVFSEHDSLVGIDLDGCV